MTTINRTISSANSYSSGVQLIQVVTVAMILLFVAQHVKAESNWLQECGVCHCKWISAKKSANCKNNSLQSIPNDLSNEMQVIDLSYNQIAEIQRDAFKNVNLIYLHKVFMRNCTLQEINRDALRGLHVLIELDFSNNQVSVLHPGTFAETMRLRTLIMNNNEIEVLEDNLFENLTFLNKIEFKSNRIHQIGNIFVDVTNITAIFLDYNRLTVLKEDTFKNIKKLVSLSLSENPWNCTCELQQFQRFVLSRNLYTSPTSCTEPGHLRHKLWSEIPAENFACRPKILTPIAGTSIEVTGENITLICRVKGSPKPDILWIYNKRPINYNDPRILIKNSQEINRRDSSDVFISELMIVGVKGTDRGSYTCSAANKGGSDEVELLLTIQTQVVATETEMTSSTNWLLLGCLITLIILIIIIITSVGIWCYCRRIKKYSKNGSISENGLVPNKLDKTQVNDSILEGSIIMEAHKSLLTEVNPVEKPPRRTELDSTGDLLDDGLELKKTLLDETNFGSTEEETHSVSLSDTTARCRTTYVDDGYGTNLPPDLLAFSARFPQSPSLQNSISNIQDGRLYAVKSPLASPIYQHNSPSIYSTPPNSGFRTLQHPKIGRNISLSQRSNSPFTPAPVLYTPVVMKQGYVTIPRKPRTPSWAPSLSSTLTDFPPTSPTSTMSSEIVEPVYDNLGLRTTASGNSVLNLNKTSSGAATTAVTTAMPLNNNKYTMKDRPLPATPKSYEFTPEASQQTTIGVNTTTPIIGDNIQYLNPNRTSPLTNGGNTEKVTKVPPRPPPKPKKKRNGTVVGAGSSNIKGSTSQLFEDEDEDGTEV